MRACIKKVSFATKTVEHSIFHLTLCIPETGEQNATIEIRDTTKNIATKLGFQYDEKSGDIFGVPSKNTECIISNTPNGYEIVEFLNVKCKCPIQL